MRRALAVIAVTALCTLVAFLTLDRRLPYGSTAPIAWTLAGVSGDARTLTIVHELPHCETFAGKAIVRETTDSVEITVPQHRSRHFGSGMACTMELRTGDEDVHLRAPLASRTLSEPRAGRGDGAHVDPLPTSVPDTEECGRLGGLPVAAPALGVPWVARRARLCTAPLPPTTLPVQQRSRTSADDLPASFKEALHGQPIVLRPQESRRLVAGAAVWLIPGPVRTCVGRLVARQPWLSTCFSTRTVNGEGLVVPATCIGNHTPSRISLIGVVPHGIRHVRLTPRRGAARTVPVHGGAWTATVDYPAHVTYGSAGYETNYRFRTCLG